jgi:phosphoserine phosphatase RsbX
MDTPVSNRSIEWAVAQLPAPGEAVSGDRHVVLSHAGGVLLAVVDGCGHGVEAAKAADEAVETLRRHAGDSVLAQLKHCHAALGGTRGAVMTVAELTLEDEALTLAGIGNVEATVFRAHARPSSPARECALLRGGTVGQSMPAPYASVIPVYSGDVLVMATDGVRTDTWPELALKSPPQRIADQILQRNFKGNDDALALVARFHLNAHE